MRHPRLDRAAILKIIFQREVKIERIAGANAEDQADGIATFENELFEQRVITE